jgi:cysteine desulfuration protein SufE
MPELPSFAEIADNLSLLDDWQDRDQYVMELGEMLPELTDDERSPASKVSGCQSQVWVISEKDGDAIRFRADSDARLVKGRAAILVALLSGRPAAEIVAADPEQAFSDIGLRANLSLGRANGLRSMIARMKADAARLG